MYGLSMMLNARCDSQQQNNQYPVTYTAFATYGILQCCCSVYIAFEGLKGYTLSLVPQLYPHAKTKYT